jgi:hypothetical protein
MMVSPFQPHWDMYPRSYAAPKTSFPGLIDRLDGDLTKDVWSGVPWSDTFDDIRGVEDAPNDARPRPTCRTRFKAIWDDSHLYIGAMLESDFETQAHFTERNSPIFQKDSDFEVFVDPMGSTHDYKELEVNAINTVWNLLLDKPYDNGGAEHSGRIAKPGEKCYYEVYKQKTAVQVLKGRLNDPKDGATWSVEIALSYDDILANITKTCDCNGCGNPPVVGSMWRINFSRVEKQGDINWTWQPQLVWDPARRRYSGYVAMHLPDAWGYIVFGGGGGGGGNGQTNANPDDIREERSSSSSSIHGRDPTWPARLAAMNVYYAQHYYRNNNGDNSFASIMEELKDLVDQKIVEPFDIRIQLSSASNGAGTSGTNDEFTVIVRHGQDCQVVTVTQDRTLLVQKSNDYDKDGGISSVQNSL